LRQLRTSGDNYQVENKRLVLIAEQSRLSFAVEVEIRVTALMQAGAGGRGFL
jgi:hypothetical protein